MSNRIEKKICGLVVCLMLVATASFAVGKENEIGGGTDITPPEALIHLDAVSKDIVVYGTDNIDEDVEITSTIIGQSENEKVIQYLLKDDAGNTLLLELEIEERWEDNYDEKQIESNILKMCYNNGEPIIPPKNEYDATVKGFKYDNGLEIKQFIEVKYQFNFKTHYNSEIDETKINFEQEGKDKKEWFIDGMIIVDLKTNKGELSWYVRPPNPTIEIDPPKYPNTVTDTNDNLHMVWQEEKEGGDYEIYYSNDIGVGEIARKIAQALNEIRYLYNLDPTFTGIGITYITLDYTGTGTVHIKAYDGTELIYDHPGVEPETTFIISGLPLEPGAENGPPDELLGPETLIVLYDNVTKELIDEQTIPTTYEGIPDPDTQFGDLTLLNYGVMEEPTGPLANAKVELNAAQEKILEFEYNIAIDHIQDAVKYLEYPTVKPFTIEIINNLVSATSDEVKYTITYGEYQLGWENQYVTESWTNFKMAEILFEDGDYDIGFVYLKNAYTTILERISTEEGQATGWGCLRQASQTNTPSKNAQIMMDATHPQRAHITWTEQRDYGEQVFWIYVDEYGLSWYGGEEMIFMLHTSLDKLLEEGKVTEGEYDIKNGLINDFSDDLYDVDPGSGSTIINPYYKNNIAGIIDDVVEIGVGIIERFLCLVWPYIEDYLHEGIVPVHYVNPVETWALLAAPRADGGYEYFKTEIMDMRTWLLGSDPHQRKPYKTWTDGGSPDHMKVYTKGNGNVDATATEDNIKSGLDHIISNSDSNDIVFIFLKNHGSDSGGSTYFCTDTTSFYETELDSKLDSMSFDECTVCVSCCHSGGFCTTPGTCAGSNRLIVCSTQYDQSAWGGNYVLLRGLKNVPTDYNVADGKYSVEEAHDWEADNLSGNPNQNPVKDDQISGETFL